MKEDWRTEHINNEDEKESAWDEAFFYADQHEQSNVNVSESRAMKRDWRAEDVSNRDKKKSAWNEAFFYTEQHS
jgi:hypothetical protein